MKKIILIIGLVAVMMLPGVVLADGGMIVPPGYWGYETDQKAVIIHQNNVETLILSTTFEGDAKDFAWIVPTPSIPTVNKAPYSLFTSLEKLTQVSGPSVVYDRAFGSLGSPAAEQKAVEVIEEKKIDIYDITVLKATDKNSLYDWLKEHNYQYPEASKYILDDYIQNNWIFTAIKVSTESLGIAAGPLRRGTATPLKLVFNSDKIVYPLKISAVTTEGPSSTSSTGPLFEWGTSTSKEIVPVPPSEYRPSYRNVSIMLYVFSDHKKEAIGFTAQWADWVDKDEIKKLAFDDKGDPWYQPQDDLYLTRLYRYMSPSEMKDDVFLINSADNDTIPPGKFWTIFWIAVAVFIIGLVFPFSVAYYVFLILFILIKGRSNRIAFTISKSVVTFAMLLVWLLFIFGFRASADHELMIGTITGGGPVILGMIIGIVLEIISLRKKKDIIT